MVKIAVIQEEAGQVIQRWKLTRGKIAQNPAQILRFSDQSVVSRYVKLDGSTSSTLEQTYRIKRKNLKLLTDRTTLSQTVLS